MKKFLEFCLVVCVSWYGITTGCPAIGAEPRIQRQHYINDRGEDVYHGTILRRANDNKVDVWTPVGSQNNVFDIVKYHSQLEYQMKFNNKIVQENKKKTYATDCAKAVDYWTKKNIEKNSK